MHKPGLAELPLSRITAPAKEDQGGFLLLFLLFSPIFSYFSKPGCTAGCEAVSLEELRFSAPCSLTDSQLLYPTWTIFSQTGAIAAPPLPAGVTFLGGFSSHPVPARFPCAVIQAPRQHVELRFALIKLLDHSHSLCISTVKRCVSTGLRIREI